MHYPSFVMAAIALTAFSIHGRAGEDDRAQREARRQQELGRRDIEERERVQAEALRGQEEALRRMEARRSSIEADNNRIAQQSADLQRDYTYRYNTLTVPMPAYATPNDAVGGMVFVPLSERLGSYFGVQSGVLVARAGADAPFGLQDGDVILSIDGRVPGDGAHAANILRSYKPGERAKLKVQRDRKAIDLDATAPPQRGN